MFLKNKKHNLRVFLIYNAFLIVFNVDLHKYNNKLYSFVMQNFNAVEITLFTFSTLFG